MNRLILLSGLIVLTMICRAAPAVSDSIDIDGVTRTFIAQIPDAKPAPLVIVLHGNAESGADLANQTSWRAIAKRSGFGVIFPDGYNRAWADRNPKRVERARPDVTSDIAFIVRLVGKFTADGTADPKRIYVTGVSKGGAMAMEMICERADLFSAAASVIINLTDESAGGCHPSRAVPMLMMNGTADPLIPYEGSRGATGFWSTAKSLEFWRRNNGCEAQDGTSNDLHDRESDQTISATRIDSRCPPGLDVVLYRINNGGHRLPGTFREARSPRVVKTSLNPQASEVDGPSIIWAFFQKFQ
jgi:polyhydroxybutyrate depolymerase